MKKFTLNIPAGVIEVDEEQANRDGKAGIFSLPIDRAKQIAELAIDANDATTTWTDFLHEAFDSIKPTSANEILYIIFLFGRLYNRQFYDIPMM